MTNEQFEALVDGLEQQAQKNPGRYRIKVLLLALLGNVYLGTMLLVLTAVLAALAAAVMVLKALAVKLILVVGFFLWIILKALWVRVEPPAGTEIKVGQAPDLFAMIDELRRKSGAPRLHQVLITEDFNAGIVQSPRLGLFGWPRNYLLIGLPLLKALRVLQFKAVLAHEFGHLANGHGKVSNGIYRQRLRWSRLLAALDGGESRGSFLFKPFLNWFVPYFNAYSFPMARTNEYEADAMSVRLTSSQAAAAALTNVNVVGRYLTERYWQRIYQQADQQPYPGVLPYCAMSRGVATEVDDASAQTWLDQAIARQTDLADTHPAFKDRLNAIGEPPCLAPPVLGQAADRLLGGALAAITESFDRRWREHVLPSWEARYRQVQQDRRQLAELNMRCRSGEELTFQEAYERARLTGSAGNDTEDALAQFRLLHERDPDDALTGLSLGARLLTADDAEGCALIERVMQLDESVIVNGCELLRDYHWRQGRKEEAYAWHRHLIERLQLQEAAGKERNRLALNDTFECHGLADETIAELRAELMTVAGLRQVYLVKKRVKHLAHLPCYVLGYRVTGFFQLHHRRRAQAALRQIQETVVFPGETLIINIDGANARFGRRFRPLDGARIL